MKRLLLVVGVCASVGIAAGVGTTVGHAASKGDCAGATECEIYVVVNGSGTVTGPGISCPSKCIIRQPNAFGGTYTATPDSGQYFHGWSGGNGQCEGAPTNPTCTINVGGYYPDYAQLTATFTSSPPPPTTATLSVTKAGTGTGAVSSSPVGIDCGTTCSASFQLNTSVTLTAAANASSTFAGWNGACTGTSICTLTMDSDKAATATFTAFPKLTVAKAGNGVGTIESTPAGIDCGQTCQASFAPGTALSLTAAAGPKSLLTGWAGACTGTASACALTTTADTSAAATFELLPTHSRLLARRTKVTGCDVVGPLPDRSCSPGAIFSDATLELICAPGYTTSVNHVAGPETSAAYTEYGLTSLHRGRSYEIDHIVPTELGGSNAIANLYPEGASPAPGFHVKDKLEKQLHALVCAKKMRLSSAQRSIASNWTRLYKLVYHKPA